MIYTVLVNPEAKLDLIDAADWYEEQRTGYGYEFMLKFNEAIDILSKNPYIFQEVYNCFRRALMKKFPYAIFYSIDENEVEIIGVFSTSRNPDIWKHRIKLK